MVQEVFSGCLLGNFKSGSELKIIDISARVVNHLSIIADSGNGMPGPLGTDQCKIALK